MIYSVLKFISFVLSKIFFRIKIYGRGNLPSQGGFIIAANHASNLDPVIIGCVCPRKVCYMAKEELFRNPLMAWLLRNLWVFPVKRQSADIAAIKEAMKKIRSGIPMLLFPQGSRNAVVSDEAPLAGVGFLAAKLKVAVVPAFIRGTDKAMPPGARFFRFCDVRVYFGKAIKVNEKIPYADTARKIMLEIAALGRVSA